MNSSSDDVVSDNQPNPNQQGQQRLSESAVKEVNTQTDWLSVLESLEYAYGQPKVQGRLKVSPSDFKVIEQMDVVPCGEGEHYWLDISKVKCNTEQLSKQLARFANVNYRDVGYSGMKDFFAETRQWFSVWKPKGGVPAWSEFTHEGVQIHQVVKHSRKIKRGTHRANKFELIIRDLCGDVSSLESRLLLVKEHGVPNYFGLQRFGNGADNMNQAHAMFAGIKRVKSRNLRGLLLSSARSWLFNILIAERIKQSTWDQLHDNEPANLNGTNSVFISQGTSDDLARLKSNDIHPTAAMWGEGRGAMMSGCPNLAQWEDAVMQPYHALKLGLEDARVDYQRRAIRCMANDLNWQVTDGELKLDFELQRGQFATSILREIVDVVGGL